MKALVEPISVIDRSPRRNPASASILLNALFPLYARAAEMRMRGDPSLLLPEEARHLGAAAEKRAREFTAGRLCARRALAESGAPDGPLKVGNDRLPSWPSGFTGSITHAEGFCGAVVAKRRDARALGLDAEVIAQVSLEIWPEILTATETVWIKTLPPGQQRRAAALIFSAKEAFFKCQYAVTGEWLDFQAVAIGLSRGNLCAGQFAVYPLIKMAILDHYASPLMGRFGFAGRLVFTGMAFVA